MTLTEAPSLTLAQQASHEIISSREEIEQAGKIPTALAGRLDSCGFYRLYVPALFGGYELSPLIAFEIIEELSKADGSVGWCLMNANGIGLATGWLSPEVGTEIGPFLRAAGSLRPQGRAWPVDGGYRVQGRWNFGSGVHNANWLFCPCVVMDGDAPRLTPAGTAVTRTMWIPASAAEIVNTWSVIGLRGTGSDDFVINEAFVPQSHSISVQEDSKHEGILYQRRPFNAFLYALFAAHGLGIARAAISSLIEMADNASSLSPAPLRDRPSVHGRLGQAEAIINAARTYVVEYLTRLWEAACQRSVGDLDIAHFRLAATHAVNEALRVVDLIFHAVGTNALYLANPLERQFRDMHAAVQHYAAFPIHYESAGRIFLGLRPVPSEPGW